MRKPDVAYFMAVGPPNSPPTSFERRSTRTRMVIKASVQNRVTEKARLEKMIIQLWRDSFLARIDVLGRIMLTIFHLSECTPNCNNWNIFRGKSLHKYSIHLKFRSRYKMAKAPIFRCWNLRTSTDVLHRLLIERVQWIEPIIFWVILWRKFPMSLRSKNHSFPSYMIIKKFWFFLNVLNILYLLVPLTVLKE